MQESKRRRGGVGPPRLGLRIPETVGRWFYHSVMSTTTDTTTPRAVPRAEAQADAYGAGMGLHVRRLAAAPVGTMMW